MVTIVQICIVQIHICGMIFLHRGRQNSLKEYCFCIRMQLQDQFSVKLPRMQHESVKYGKNGAKIFNFVRTNMSENTL